MHELSSPKGKSAIILDIHIIQPSCHATYDRIFRNHMVEARDLTLEFRLHFEAEVFEKSRVQKKKIK